MKSHFYPSSLVRLGLFFLGVWLMLSASTASAAPARLADGLLFYAPFEKDSVNARVAEGDPTGKATDATFVAGRVGKGVSLAATPLSYLQIGNFRHRRGTLSLWVKDLGPLAEGKNTAGLFDAVNFAINVEEGKNTLFFMTGSDIPQGGFAWDYSCQTKTYGRFERWTHLAATWNQATNEKAFYVNGKLISSVTTERMRQEMASIRLKMELGKNAPVSVDEVALWGRVLSAEEIDVLAMTPAALAAAAERLPVPQPPQRDPLEIGLHAGAIERSIVSPGEPFAIQVPVTNNTQVDWAGVVELALLDYDEREIERVAKPIKLAAGLSVKLSHRFTVAEPGIYKIAARTERPAQLKDVASFVVWPERTPLSDDSFFGVHANSWSEAVIALSARLGYRWNRNHNMLQTTWWPRVQPEPGEFQWLHDPSLDLNLRHDFRIVGQFFGTPYWAAAGGPLKPQKVTPGDSAYPYGARPELSAYRTYVFETVSRYKDRIHYWETWNEPDVSMFWNGSPEEFAELAQATVEEVRRADPKAFLMVGGFATGWPWTERAARAGAYKGADAVSIHLYSSATRTPEQLYAGYEAAMKFHCGLITQYADRPDLPIWQSEGGLNATTWLRGARLPNWPPAKVLPPMNARLAASRQVQSDVFFQHFGLAHSFTYLTNPSKNYADLVDLDINGTPKPHMISRAVLARQVDGLTQRDLVRQPATRFWAAVYAAPSDAETLVVAWLGEGGEAGLAPDALGGALVSQLDLMGRALPASDSIRITDTPSYLRVAAAPAAVAAALRTASLEVRVAPAPALEVSTENAPQVKVLPDYAAPIEKPSGVFTVDLRPFANMDFADEKAGDGVGGWADEGDLNDLRTFERGRRVFYGVPFDIALPTENQGRAIITLYGGALTPKLPEAVKGIPIPSGSVRALYFLHAAAWAKPGTIARYIVRYADGTTAELPVTVGLNTGDWWAGQGAEETDSRVVSIKVTPVQGSDKGWRYLRVWEWQNPKPRVEIVSVDFVAEPGGKATPILIGISGVKW